MGLDDVLRHVADDPVRCAVFSDLDGTLSRIVDDPDSVVPVDGAAEVLSQLAEKLGMVAVVSGRPVSFLERFFSPPIELSGLYGLEHRTGDRLFVDSAALQWLPVMTSTAERAREQFGPDAVEDKRYSITVHYRGADADFVEAVTTWAAETALETGLDARAAKMSVELHPPTSRSKGDAVEGLLGGIRCAVYLGDDVGDLPAFRRLADLHKAGELDAYAVVLVASHETVPEMHQHATLEVSTAEEALELLRQIARSCEAGSGG